MRNGAASSFVILLILSANAPAYCDEPVYLKCPGEVRSIKFDLNKSTQSEELYQQTYILKIDGDSFQVLERRDDDRVWVDYCSIPAAGVSCTVSHSDITLRRSRGIDYVEVWQVDRVTDKMTIQIAARLSDTGEPLEDRSVFTGQCTMVKDDPPNSESSPIPGQ